MVSVSESASTAKSQLAANIAAGVNALSQNQTVTFTKYVRVVLPLDGFVFWVKADILSASALFNAGQFNRVTPNAHPSVITPAPTIVVQGSLHYATENNQNEDETAGVNQVVFTALSPVTDFNEIGGNVVFIAALGDDGVQYAFNSRGPFYAQADTYHYMGTAILPAMRSQIINSPAQLDRDLVVSNSLPLWLSFNQYRPPYPGLTTNGLMLYPSFAVPSNLPPPYGAVHIEPTNTRALQATAWLSSSLSHSQLTRDLVRVTVYGMRNEGILNFIDFVNQYSYDTDNIGIMNMPIVQDEKRTQSELNILAMKKTIEFEVSYYQTSIRQAVRQLLTSTIIDYEPSL